VKGEKGRGELINPFLQLGGSPSSSPDGVKRCQELIEEESGLSIWGETILSRKSRRWGERGKSSATYSFTQKSAADVSLVGKCKDLVDREE